MAKVNRQKLERGKKLVKEHVFTPLASIVTDLNGAGIDAEQLEAEWAPFRLNYSVPYFGSDSRSSDLSIPFVLPPLQDSMSFTSVRKTYINRAGATVTSDELSPATTSTTTQIFLDEVSFGFDQRDAPAAIASHFYNNGLGSSADQGKLCYDLIDKYVVRLSIVEKDPLFFVPLAARTEEHEIPRREVWSVSIPAESFANDVFALNPYVVSGINEQIDPWKSYIFTMSFPAIGNYADNGLAANAPAASVVSIEASLKFRARVMKRNNRATWAPDNVPTSALTKRSRTAAGNPVAHSAPADGAKITADTTTGVSINMASVDEAFRSKLYSGFNEQCEAGQTTEAIAEEIDPDAAYEVIVVPLFQNSNLGGVSMETVPVQPYSVESGGITDSVLIDRRIIPINYPMQIEHVVVALNWQGFYAVTASGPVDGRLHPSAVVSGASGAAFNYDIGVGVGTGMKGDDFDYAQIARARNTAGAAQQWNPGALGPDFVIDKLRAGPERHLPHATGGVRTNNLELWSLPLVPVGGGAGTEVSYMYDSSQTTKVGLQGKPLFVGRSWAPTATRTDQLATAGREQWIEVRARISNLSNPSSHINDTVVVGYQGFFVYIIGRKFLVS